MKFIINKEEFLKGITNAGRVAQNKIDPILANLKLDLFENYLEITGSNGNLTISTRIQAVKEDKEIIRDIEEGSILINAHLINEIVKRFDGDEVLFEILDDTMAKIESDNCSFKLSSIRAEEYREIELSLDGIKVTISANDFIDAVNQVGFCASEKSSRPTLTAVNVECNSSTLTFVSTDGARLGKKELFVENNELFNVNIPAKALFEAIKTITNEKEVSLYVGDKKVAFKFEDTIMTTTLIGGEYPNVKNIIPRSFYYFLEVNANEFLRAIDMGAITSGDRENIVKVIMEEGSVTITSKSQQSGSSQVRLDLFKYTGERLEMSFNCAYVSSAIRALKSQDVLLSFVGEMKPFTVTNKNDETVIQLITPVRTY